MTVEKTFRAQTDPAAGAPGAEARRRFLQIIGAGAGMTALGGAQARTLNGSNATGYWNAVENSFVLNQ